jgi:hypothetical protein
MFTALGVGFSCLASIAAKPLILLYEQKDIYLWILVILASVLSVPSIFAPQVYQRIFLWINRTIKALIVLFDGITRGKKLNNGTPDKDDELYKVIEESGYSYDPEQDIFYSNMNAWQRNMGYCRLYDEAAAPMGMIIDCEPIYFEYDSKRWLIELWKGQYDLTTGCEIGLYTTKEPNLNIPDVFKGPFFQCASDEERLYMEYYVMKNDEFLFSREDNHWWLTGFKLGEFSEPSELTMYLSITFKNGVMREAFVAGLLNAGYLEHEMDIDESTVKLKFDKTHTQQPITRTELTDHIIQRKNQILCERYQEITKSYDTFPEKMKAIQEQSPELYQLVLHIGKTKQLFESFDIIKDYMS